MLSQTELTTSQLPGAAATAPPEQVAAAPQGKRLLFIDNLRILLICGVLVVHLDDTYGAIGSWDYHDPATNLLTGALLSIPNAIGMASGMGAFFYSLAILRLAPMIARVPEHFCKIGSCAWGFLCCSTIY